MSRAYSASPDPARRLAPAADPAHWRHPAQRRPNPVVHATAAAATASLADAPRAQRQLAWAAGLGASPRAAAQRAALARLSGPAGQHPHPGAAARPVPAAAGGPVQRQAYTVARSLPLEPHFREWKDNAEDREKATKELLGKVRLAYPLPADTERLADQEEWPADQRDQHRGPEFTQRKLSLLQQLQPGKDPADGGSSASFWTRDAHVASLSVASERDRAGTAESKATKTVTGMDWIGAHLVKRAWGGEDNMWNVVCWPKTAEAKWGAEFENPVDLAFAVQRQRKLDISIEVSKEDEAIDVDTVRQQAAALGMGKAEAWQKAIAADGLKAAYEANRAIESIPQAALGQSDLSRSSLTAADTLWNVAKEKADAYVAKKMKAIADKAPHVNRPLSDPKAVETDKQNELRTERQQALDQERRNYRPERYDMAHGLPGDEGLLRDLPADPIGDVAHREYLAQSGHEKYVPPVRNRK